MTILVSIGLDISLAFKMFKDIADQGYKLEMDKISELGRQMNPETSKNNAMSLFIPFFNLFFQMNKKTKYEQTRPFLADQLRIMDCITPFTKEEQENYNKKPTGFNAFLTIIKSELADESEMDVSISFDDDGEKSTIWFEKINDDFRVIKTRGPVSRLSLEEQKNILIEKLMIVGKELKSRITSEELEKAIKENKTINLSQIPIKEEVKTEIENGNHSKSDIKQQLERLRNDIVSFNEHDVDSEKGYSKVLKPHDKK